MSYKIEHNIPMPHGKQAALGILPTLRETFEHMSVGDSFLYDGRASDVYRAAPDYTIMTRKMEKGQIRVWLVSIHRKKDKKRK